MSETVSDQLLADVEEAMRDVVDPELGINVVDLGLIYGLNVEKASEGGGGLHGVCRRHDPTSAACPLTGCDRGSGERRTGGGRSGQRGQAQLGVEPAVGPGQDHRRRA